MEPERIVDVHTHQSGPPAAGAGQAREESLDPANWPELRALGHRMLDDILDYLGSVRQRPVWQPVPEAVRRRIRQPLPAGPSDAAAVYEEFKETVMPYPTGNIHPRFWGWVMGTGTPLAMLADMLASGMNPHVAGYDQSAAIVEKQAVAWLAELLGFPASASGLVVGGGTMANLIGVAVARHVKAGFDVRTEGLQRGGPELVLYASTETHGWAQRAAELLGLGNRSLRRLPVDEAFRMSVLALEEALQEDRKAGRRPFCVIGTAGTVNTGATDDLQRLAVLCRDEGLWFHVDGAFGALAALAPDCRDRVAGIEQADSIAFDLHKWMYLPFEAGCALVRDAGAHRATFSMAPSYLAPTGRGILPQPLEFAGLGLDLSRGFRALKVWMSLKVHGTRAFGRLIQQNVEQAAYLKRLVEREAELELLAPVALNVVCFRLHPQGIDDEVVLSRLNEELLLRLQESGIAVISSTVLRGRFALRVAITNHRSRREDFDLLVRTVLALGRDVVPTASVPR